MFFSTNLVMFLMKKQQNPCPLNIILASGFGIKTYRAEVQVYMHSSLYEKLPYHLVWGHVISHNICILLKNKDGFGVGGWCSVSVLPDSDFFSVCKWSASRMVCVFLLLLEILSNMFPSPCHSHDISLQNATTGSLLHLKQSHSNYRKEKNL